MPGHISAHEDAIVPYASGSPRPRLVLVDEPERLIREALVAAIDAEPGLSAMDGADAGPPAVDRVDAAVLTAGSLRFGCNGLLDGARDGQGASPVVIVADDGPVAPALDDRGLVVVSRETPLSAIVECLRADDVDLRRLPRWRQDAGPPAPALTAREREVLGLLASGLSPTEVARGLAITIYTTRDHIKAIREKLDRPTIMAAVLEAIRRGMLHLEPV
jgi:two-component system nitrate/nitrite response regulator NarL